MEVKSVRKPSKREGGDGTMDAEGEGVKGGAEGRKLRRGRRGSTRDRPGVTTRMVPLMAPLGIQRLWTEGNTRGRRGEVERAGAFTYLMVEIRCQRQTWDLP